MILHSKWQNVKNNVTALYLRLLKLCTCFLHFVQYTQSQQEWTYHSIREGTLLVISHNAVHFAFT